MEANKYNIVCFMCNWTFCQEEMQIPSDVNVVRVMCIGRIDPAIILETFEKGVDGVMLVGCKPPDCHYIDGNLQAERAVKMLRKLLKLAGLETGRIKLLWHSPMDEKSFGSYAKKFLHEIKEIGFSSLKRAPNSGLLVNVLAAKNAASDFRLRVLLGREKELTEGVNVYGEKLSTEEFDALLDEIVTEEFVRHKIHVLTKTEPLSVKALADALEMKTANVLRHIVNMRRKNMIALDHVEGATPFYRALEVK
ncbi:MAG: hydrogenase iron-sulfur subunit [Candidatus Bathycorpusculaceae bacterium]